MDTWRSTRQLCEATVRRSVRGDRELRVLPVLRPRRVQLGARGLGARGPGVHSRRLAAKPETGAGATSAGRRSAQALLRLRAAQQCEAPGPLSTRKARTCDAVRVTAHAWLAARPRPRPCAARPRDAPPPPANPVHRRQEREGSRVTFYKGRLLSARGP